MSHHRLAVTDDELLSADAIDLCAYLDRIGYSGPLSPTLDLLTTVVAKHMATIPFETIDVMLERHIDLTPAIVDRKMLAGRRGGYCFEHASLLRRALLAIGFPVEQHLARVWIHNRLVATLPAATHTSLKIGADDRLWLVDVGFGAFLPNAPLAWQPNTPQSTDFGAFRLIETGDGYMLEFLRDHRWEPLYEILDFHCHTTDFEIANDYVSRYLGLCFRQDFLVVRTERDTRHILVGNRLTVERKCGFHEERTLDEQGMAAVLAEIFGMPVLPDWQRLIARAVGSAR